MAQFETGMLPFPHKNFILQIRAFLKCAMNSAFHFPGSFTWWNLLWCVSAIKQDIEEEKISANHSKVQSDDIKQPVRLRVSTEDYEMTQRSNKEHTAIPQPQPSSHRTAMAAMEERTNTAPGGLVGCWLLEQPDVPALPLYSNQRYASRAWNKSYSVPVTVSKTAATGCSSCLLLEQLLH